MNVSKSEIKYLRSLSQKKVRQQEKKFLLEGWRALKEALNSGPPGRGRTGFKIEYVAMLPRFIDDPDYSNITKELAKRRIEVKEMTEADLNSVADTVHAQGVVALIHQKSFDLSDRGLKQASLIVAADGVSDPGNLGSILRTCDWFGVDLLFLGRGCVELYNEKVIRSTVGSIFHLAAIEGVDLPNELLNLKKLGFSIIALAGDGSVAYQQHSFERRTVLVVGSEAHGVSKEVRAVADHVVKIPKYGKAESLNLGVACGIVLAHVRSMSNDQ